MSEGATASAPARACESATRASSGSVASLSTWPSCRTPQAPCEVYWQRHTSVSTGSPGAWVRIARIARLHGAGVVPGGRPLLILAIGQPEQQHSAHPTGLGLGRQARGDVGRDVALAGERRDRPVDARAADDEERLNQVCGRDARLAHEAAQTLGTSQAAHANSGETHTGSVDAARRGLLRRRPYPPTGWVFHPYETVYGALRLTPRSPPKAALDPGPTGPSCL